ncbi:MAG: hypothetical protein P3W94_000980 [Paracoccus sp. (in: a-proteobacteria)]|nr:hypothetical protein [Paracoccus sp. (in: a-proteobacteria)]
MNIEHLLQGALLLASLGLAVFCVILARRLRRLNDLETGLGGAIAVMAVEVDRLEQAIRTARDEATKAREALSDDIATARQERAIWDLRQKLAVAAASPDPTVVPAGLRQSVPMTAARRLRKRQETAHG